jgi:hypothetical protein
MDTTDGDGVSTAASPCKNNDWAVQLRHYTERTFSAQCGLRTACHNTWSKHACGAGMFDMYADLSCFQSVYVNEQSNQTAPACYPIGYRPWITGAYIVRYDNGTMMVPPPPPGMPEGTVCVENIRHFNGLSVKVPRGLPFQLAVDGLFGVTGTTRVLAGVHGSSSVKLRGPPHRNPGCSGCPTG